MKTDYYVVKFLKDNSPEANKKLLSEIAKYEAGKYTNIGVNLSELSMIKSSQIGYIAKCIKASDAKGKKTVILAATNVLYDILTTVHFHKKAEIVLDESDFVNALVNHSPSGKSSAKKVEKPKTVSFMNFFFSKIREKLSLIIIILLFITVIVLAAASAYVSKQYKNLKIKNVTQCVLIQKKIDSLSNVIKLYKVEEELMNEINNATIDEEK